QDGADEDGATEAQDAVGDPAAGQRREIYAGGVDPDDGGRLTAFEAEPSIADGGGHEEHQQRSQPVVAEALPHLREEERGESTGVAEEAVIAGGGGGAAADGGGLQRWIHGVAPDARMGTGLRRAVASCLLLIGHVPRRQRRILAEKEVFHLAPEQLLRFF